MLTFLRRFSFLKRHFLDEQVFLFDSIFAIRVAFEKVIHRFK